ncbi:MAG: NblA/ycf18 family protein [Leptolyngbyaceae cyanobacterium MO_188.B28]|nr:NblA/ycf18 family protein [Leptolyngbyaceae cyanobacterium MO_188.B28]
MKFPASLSTEQQFRLKVLSEEVKRLNQEEAQSYLLEVLRQLMVKDNFVKQVLKGDF